MQAFGALWLWSDLFLAISAIMNPWCLFQYSYLLTKLSKMACFKTAANSNKPGMHMTTRTYLCMCIVHLPIKLVLLLVRYKLYGWNRTVCTSRTWACAHTRRHHHQTYFPDHTSWMRCRRFGPSRQFIQRVHLIHQVIMKQVRDPKKWCTKFQL